MQLVTLGEPYIYHDLGVIYKNEGSIRNFSLTISVATETLFGYSEIVGDFRRMN